MVRHGNRFPGCALIKASGKQPVVLDVAHLEEVEERVELHPGVTDVKIVWGEMTPEERSDEGSPS